MARALEIKKDRGWMVKKQQLRTWFGSQARLAAILERARKLIMRKCSSTVWQLHFIEFSSLGGWNTASCQQTHGFWKSV